MVGVMITNGNNVHPPAYHAEVTADKVIEVLEAAGHRDGLRVPRDVRMGLLDVLTVHHEAVGASESDALSEHDEERYEHELNADDHVHDHLIDDLKAATENTPFHAFFARTDVNDLIKEILHHEARSQMQVHRVVHKEAKRLARLPRAVK